MREIPNSMAVCEGVTVAEVIAVIKGRTTCPITEIHNWPGQTSREYSIHRLSPSSHGKREDGNEMGKLTGTNAPTRTAVIQSVLRRNLGYR